MSLKFAPSKLVRVKQQLGKKRSLEANGDEVRRKSKRASVLQAKQVVYFAPKSVVSFIVVQQ